MLPLCLTIGISSSERDTLLERQKIPRKMSIEANFVKQPQQASSWMDAAAEPIPLRVALQVGSSRPSSLRVHRAADPAVSAEAANNSCASATTIRRLSYAEVRSIFDCLHLNQPPPVDLPFTIVPAGPNSEKLSPPSFEFAGTYGHDSQSVRSARD